MCAPRDHLSTLEEVVLFCSLYSQFCEYAVRVIHDNADQVFSLFQQEMVVLHLVCYGVESLHRRAAYEAKQGEERSTGTQDPSLHSV